MYFSSLVLTAVAHLTPAVSGIYLIKANHATLAPYGWAKVSFGRDIAEVAFFREDTRPYAAIHLDSAGNIGAGWVLKDMGETEYELVSRVGAGVGSNDITGPFAVEADNRFVYKGEGGGVWTLCPHDGNYLILLTRGGNTGSDCIKDVTLLAYEF